MSRIDAVLIEDIDKEIEGIIREEVKNLNYSYLPYTVGGASLTAENNIVTQKLRMYYFDKMDNVKYLESYREYKYQPSSEYILKNYIEAITSLQERISKEYKFKYMIARYKDYNQEKYFEEQQLLQDMLIESYIKNHEVNGWSEE